MAAVDILEKVPCLTLNDTRVPARNAVIEQHQVIVALAPEREWSARDFNLTIVAGGVADDQTW